MEKVKYHEMLPYEILKRRKKFPAAFIGCGGLEWHGEHLGVGNDALKAEKLCELAAGKSGGFAMPTIWYGEPRNTGLMEVNHDDGITDKMKFKKKKFKAEYWDKEPDEQVKFYQDLVYHVLVQMNTLEMKAVCLVCGHYPLHWWIAPVVKKFNKAFKDTKAYTGIEFMYAGTGSDLVHEGGKSKKAGGDHAAKWETSYLWYLRPDCVDMSVYLGREKEKLVGVGGIDPRKEASIEVGRAGSELIVDGMVKKAKALIRRAN